MSSQPATQVGLSGLLRYGRVHFEGTVEYTDVSAHDMALHRATCLILLTASHAAFLPSRPLKLRTSRALAMAGGGAEGEESLEFEDTRLYPQPPLVANGKLPVSDLHTVAWFEYGNPDGKPVLFVHGGPGGGTAPMNARYFDPARAGSCWSTSAGAARRNPSPSSRRIRRGTSSLTLRRLGSCSASTSGRSSAAAGAARWHSRTPSATPSA